MQESDEMAPASGSDSQLASKFSKVPSASSIDSQDVQEYSESPSDDLDKLSLCLSEVSSEVGDGKKSSLLNDIIQAQLAFWTLIISIFYTYAWQQHRKKFLFSLIMVVPPVILICGTLSSLLTAIVIMGRLFSSPLKFDDVLKFGGGSDEDDEHISGATSASRSMMNLAGAGGLPLSGGLGNGGGAFNRRRTLSGNNSINNIFAGVQSSSATVPAIRRFERSGGGLSTSTFGLSGRSGGLRSSSCEELALPKPVCRKHSSHQFHTLNSCSGASGSGLGSRLFNYHHTGYSSTPTNGGLVPTVNGNAARNANEDGDELQGATTNLPTKSPSSEQLKSTIMVDEAKVDSDDKPLLENGKARNSPSPSASKANSPTKAASGGGLKTKKTGIPTPHHNQNRSATSSPKAATAGGGGSRKLAVGKRRTPANDAHNNHRHHHETPNGDVDAQTDAPSTATAGVGPKPFK